MIAQEPSGRAASAQSQSLYRKYRPQSFATSELVGQEHIARTLRNAIALDRVAHAYLFCGPRGTGKTSTARLLAKAVNCLAPDPADRPCNACEACISINQGSAVDIIEIDAASNRGVDDIRDLREKVKYAPTQLNVKFYIIDEAHQLTRDAFNAFLKTLEEPPGHVKFVLATTEPDKLPDTVASRCQRFDFRRIPVQSAIDRLKVVSELEQLEIEDDALQIIARQATGSLRDALGLLDQLALLGETPEGRTLITADMVRQVLGLSRSDRLVGLIEALSQRDVGAGLSLIAQASEGGEDVHQLNRQLVEYLRMLLHLRAGGRNAEADDVARRQADLFSLGEIAGFIRAFSSIEGAMNRGTFAQLPMELAFVDAILSSGQAGQPESAPRRSVETPPAPPPEFSGMVSPDPIRAIPTPARQPDPTPRVTPRAEPATAPPRIPQPRDVMPESPPEPGASPPVPAAPAPSSPVNGGGGAGLERLVANWVHIRRDVKTANSRIAALLGSVDPVDVRGDEVIMVSAYEFHRNKLNDDSVRRVVEDVISNYMGSLYRLNCLAPDEARLMVTGSTEAAPTSEMKVPEPEPIQDAAEQESVSDDFPALIDVDEQRLKAAKSIFNAEEIDTNE